MAASKPPPSADTEQTSLQSRIDSLERRIQIEEALERVRARSMTMHRSDDLAEVAVVLFQQLHSLGITPDRTLIPIVDEQTDSAKAWMTTQGGDQVTYGVDVTFTGHPVLEEVYNRWKKGEPFIVQDLSGRTLLDFISWIQQVSDTPYSEIPERRVYGYASFSHGMIAIAQAEPIPEETQKILVRFARVFEQTYVRFLDLKRVEDQIQEAERQAALDRFRAEIASMRTGEDLQRITPLIWRELKTLGVPFFRCGVFIMDESTRTIQSFLTTPEGEHLATLTLPYDSAANTLSLVEFWRCCEVFTDHWDRQQFLDWSRTLIEQGRIDADEQELAFSDPPPSLWLHFVPFTQGMLYVGSAEPLPEYHLQTIQALATAFSVAYARFEDFKNLELKNETLAQTLSELQSAQTQLIQAEKMASLGQLTAGIAHEIKNPLNFVNNFAEINAELLDELKSNPDARIRDLLDTIEDLQLNSAKIREHGHRADRIVRGMMEHARGGTGERQSIDVNAMLEEYVNLAYHGMRARYADFNVTIDRAYGDDTGEAEMVLQEIGRVLINLFNNAFDALREKTKISPNGFEPLLRIETSRNEENVVIRVIDNGAGIPDQVRDRVFEPFFTTKPTGQGTGLGLSLSYDIITQGHHGELSVESEPGEGSTFIIQLPLE